MDSKDFVEAAGQILNVALWDFRKIESFSPFPYYQRYFFTVITKNGWFWRCRLTDFQGQLAVSQFCNLIPLRLCQIFVPGSSFTEWFTSYVHNVVTGEYPIIRDQIFRYDFCRHRTWVLQPLSSVWYKLIFCVIGIHGCCCCLWSFSIFHV